MSEENDPLIGQSLDYVFQNPDLLRSNQEEGLGKVISINLRSPHEHEGTIGLRIGEIVELERRYKEARDLPIGKVLADRDFLRKSLINKCYTLFISVGYPDSLYDGEKYIVEDVVRIEEPTNTT